MKENVGGKMGPLETSGAERADNFAPAHSSNEADPEFLLETADIDELTKALMSQFTEQLSLAEQRIDKESDLEAANRELELGAKNEEVGAKNEEVGAKEKEVGAEKEEVGAKKEDVGSVKEERGTAVEERSSQMAEVQTEKKAIGQVKEVESVAGLEKAMQNIDNVYLQTHVEGNKVTVLQAKGCSAQKLQQADENREVAVLHDERYFAHSESGLAHGQKITVTVVDENGRKLKELTLTVHHFSAAEVKLLSKIVLNFIAQLSQKAPVTDTDLKHLLRLSASSKNSRVIVLTKSKSEHGRSHKTQPKITRNTQKSDELEKLDELKVRRERMKERALKEITQLVDKVLQFIFVQTKKFDLSHQTLFLNNLKSDHVIREISPEMLELVKPLHS